MPEAVGQVRARGAVRRGPAGNAGVDDDVGRAGQIQQSLPVALDGRVEHRAALVGVVQRERDTGTAQSWERGAGRAAAGRFDLEDLGAEVGQDAADRVALAVRQIEHAQRCQ